MAQGQVEEAKKLIDGLQETHPFDDRYAKVENQDWESCAKVIAEHEKQRDGCGEPLPEPLMPISRFTPVKDQQVIVVCDSAAITVARTRAHHGVLAICRCGARKNVKKSHG
ncbi:MAG: hypothetical protein Q8P42_16135 [Gallionella sp.]|nr:hypothetical protein [Gallionella sp.]